MRRLAATALALAACTHAATEARHEPAPAVVVQAPPVVVPKPVVEDGFVIDYRAQAEGRTLIEVARPKDAVVEIFEGNRLLAKDSAPTSAKVDADVWYRVRARLPSGVEVERKVQALHGLVTSLRFADSAPAAPSAMTPADFRRLLHTLDTQAGDESKLSLLRTAAANNYFTSAMAGEILDHVVYRENKISAVPILRARILDRQNAWTLYQHFTYREDKAKVQEMLEQ